MSFEDINARGLTLVGCGRLGSALLSGWLERGIDPAAITVSDPNPPDWLSDHGVKINVPQPSPTVMVLAVKPQMMQQALAQSAAQLDMKTICLSVAAGIPIAKLESLTNPSQPIIRAMPNTPAAIGQGITALVANPQCDAAQRQLAADLMRAVGEVVELDDEAQMDAVTALSGSGPAYVFHLIETMASAGAQLGLPREMALRLATATVAGAGQLAAQSDTGPDQLRRNVTSPGGTTEAALKILMDSDHGFPALLDQALAAAAARSKELANG